ncbi:MAG TPA: M20/M25/M40 family metallo-hydrolase [Gaiellaceae bacterium]|nr:M20/M25/M40 family metallo-hydrolase [Gaiellaceae bacterium]
MPDRVDADALAELTLELVEVSSPTGDTTDVARMYGARLAERGLEVEVLDQVFPRTPTVVGRLRGGKPGPTVVLNGHLDTVPIPHEPARLDDGRIVGRGAADMKGALACAAEAARAVAERGPFPGELVIVAIGLHEAPTGRGEDLTYLLRDGGFTADFAIVCELGGHALPVAHMGQATMEIEISRPGMATHELQAPPGTPHPLFAAGRVIEAIAARRDELAQSEHEWVGAETYFLGEVHGGDFYNRHPTRCRIVGTRRWAPGHSFEEVESELRSLLAPIVEETGCEIEPDLRLVRDTYRIDPDHLLAQALRGAYRDVTGTELPLIGMKVVADGAIFHAAGIPTVYHGPVGEGAHADVESIEVAELERATNVYLRTLERLWA